MQIRSDIANNISIRECITKEDVESTYLIMHQLRPHLVSENYYSQIFTLRSEEKYRLFGAFNGDNQCVGVMGFQLQNRLSLGKILYLADLVTDEACRSRGIGTRLLNLIKLEAANQNVEAIVLESGLQREKAHEFYQRHGYKSECYSFRLFKPFILNSMDNEESKVLSNHSQY